MTWIPRRGGRTTAAARAVRSRRVECGDDPFQDRVPRPGGDGRQAEAVRLAPQPLAVVPANPRPVRLVRVLPRSIVAQDLLLIVFVEKNGAHLYTGRDAVAGGPDGERREQEVALEHDRGAAAEVVADH